MSIPISVQNDVGVGAVTYQRPTDTPGLTPPSTATAAAQSDSVQTATPKSPTQQQIEFYRNQRLQAEAEAEQGDVQGAETASTIYQKAGLPSNLANLGPRAFYAKYAGDLGKATGTGSAGAELANNQFQAAISERAVGQGQPQAQPRQQTRNTMPSKPQVSAQSADTPQLEALKSLKFEIF